MHIVGDANDAVYDTASCLIDGHRPNRSRFRGAHGPVVGHRSHAHWGEEILQGRFVPQGLCRTTALNAKAVL